MSIYAGLLRAVDGCEFRVQQPGLTSIIFYNYRIRLDYGQFKEAIVIKKPNVLDQVIIQKLVFGYNHLRFGHYALQGALLPLIEIATLSEAPKPSRQFIDHLQLAFPKIQSLFEQDSKNIAEGVYPATVLIPENPIRHFNRIPRLFLDAFRAQKQKRAGKNKEFNTSTEVDLKDFPNYYTRNFHFQNNGYLGDESADLYEHQVEVLFAGSADAMRRQLIRPLKEKFSFSNGEGLNFLELGCGTGRATRFISLAFPKAKITCIDLSPYYLRAASSRLQKHVNISFLQGLAENLNMKDETFDAIYSAYLFHELPEKARAQVLQEGRRLLKKSGIYLIADSLQMNDDPELNWALEQFPKDFHEPFYKNYIERPLQSALEKNGFKVNSTQIGFLTKVLNANKSAKSS